MKGYIIKSANHKYSLKCSNSINSYYLNTDSLSVRHILFLNIYSLKFIRVSMTKTQNKQSFASQEFELKIFT